MKNIILKTKHWQLFVLIIGIPLLLQFAMIQFLISNIFETPKQELLVLPQFMRVMLLTMSLYVGGLFIWLWSVGIGLQDKIPTNLRLPVNRFKVLLFIPTIYFVVLISTVSVFLQSFFKGAIVIPDVEIFSYLAPFHLLSVFCILYCFYFVAKTIRTAKLKIETDTRDYLTDILLIWFFMVGVWMLQPTVNELVESENEYL